MSHDSEIAEIGRALREERRERGVKNLSAVQTSPPKAPDGSVWTKHSSTHWSATLCSERLDYWPSRNRWMWCGKVSTGNISDFIRKRQETRS